MRRTQIYLDKKDIALLTKLARDTNKTRSELIREAIAQVYGEDDVKKVIKKINGLRSFADFEFENKLREYREERQW